MEPAAARRSRRRVAGERPCQLPPCGLQAATARAGCRAAPAQLPGEAQSILQMRSAAAGPARARSPFRLEPRLCCQRAHRCCVWCPPQARSSVRPSQAARHCLPGEPTRTTRQKVVLRLPGEHSSSSPALKARQTVGALVTWSAGDIERRARAYPARRPQKHPARRHAVCTPARPSQVFPTALFARRLSASGPRQGAPS